MLNRKNKNFYAYLAGFLDGDGSIYVRAKKNDSYKYGFQIAPYIIFFQSKKEESNFEIYTEPSNLEAVKEAIVNNGIEIQNAEITMIPSNTTPVNDVNIARQILSLMDVLEEHDDVEAVYSNFDIPEEIMNQIGENG